MFLDPDKALSVFSSSGDLIQCDNALKAASNSALAIGASSSDGCVLLSFKNVPSLVEKTKYNKVFYVCPSIGVTYAGLQPDFRAQLNIAQDICQDYFDVYGKYPTMESFIAEFSLDVQEHSQKQGLRPFGTLMIFCGMGRNGPKCYQIDSTGSFTPLNTTAIGSGSERVIEFMNRRHSLLDDNIVNGLTALLENAGRELSVEDVSIGVLRNGLFTVYDYDGISEVFDSISH